MLPHILKGLQHWFRSARRRTYWIPLGGPDNQRWGNDGLCPEMTTWPTFSFVRRSISTECTSPTIFRMVCVSGTDTRFLGTSSYAVIKVRALFFQSTSLGDGGMSQAHFTSSGCWRVAYNPRAASHWPSQENKHLFHPPRESLSVQAVWDGQLPAT